MDPSPIVRIYPARAPAGECAVADRVSGARAFAGEAAGRARGFNRRMTTTANPSAPQLELEFSEPLHRRMAPGFAVDVGVVAVSIKDHDEFGGSVESCECVGCHGGELDGLAGLNGDLAFAEE